MDHRLLHWILPLLLFPQWGLAQYDSLVFDGLQRSYLVHLPTGYHEQEQLPLVIAMHGGFGSAANLQNQSGLSQTANDHHFIVVYPEGSREGLLSIRTWNAGWCCGNSSAADVDDVGFIDTLLDVLITKYAVDTNRIYATGMSNGGFMSYRLACELSNRIAAIAPVAGSLSVPTCNPIRPVPIIAFHSYLDSNVPYLGGIGDGVSDHYNAPLDSVLNAWSNKNGCQSEKLTIQDDAQFTHYEWTECECNADIEWYLTRDGGHSWPGGNQTITGDPTSQVINANELMWNFFSQHSLDCNFVSATENATRQILDAVISPNPTSGTFRIALPLDDHSRISIFDVTGRNIPFIKENQIIIIPEFNDGIYYLKIQNGDQVFNGKILLER
ncbi:MAG: T9SS type A sorting domain-containing protein [Saprospiraceae bacterium]|nr:T9SS type A sorting domain-containing protein [Saprospiraceae bacterium]